MRSALGEHRLRDLIARGAIAGIVHRHWRKRLLLSLVGLALFVFPEAHADPLARWQWATPFPHGNKLNDVIFGNDLFVAVGWKGTIITSPDGYAGQADEGVLSALHHELTL